MMRRNLIRHVAMAISVGGFLIAGVLLCGCDGNGRPAGDTGIGVPTGSITGRLVTGAGRSRAVALVAIMGTQTVTPLPSFDGNKFRIDNVPAGEQVVYIREKGVMRGAMFVALVLPGKVTDVGDVETEPLGKVSGFVYEVDEDGNKVKPIAKARVTARAIGAGDEGDELGEVSRGIFAVTETDDNGSYELLLPQGIYLIEARAPRYQPAMDTVTVDPLVTTSCDIGLQRLQEGNLGVVYGKVTAVLDGQIIPVAGATVVLAPRGVPQLPEPPFEIQPVKIEVEILLSVFPNPLGAKGKKQTVVPPAYGRIRIAFTDAEGNYRIEDVKPGGYRAVAFKEDYGVDEKTVSISPRESVRVDFELKAMFGIVQGNVRDAETKQPIRGATVTATVVGDPWFIWDKRVKAPGHGKVVIMHVCRAKQNVIPPIEPIRPPLPPITPPVRASAVTDENGFYKLVLPEGEYFVSVWKEEYVPDGAIVTVSAGQTVTRDFELTKWQPGLEVDLELPENVALGEPVKMKLILRNRGNEPVKLSFRTGQRYDFIVRNMDGEVVWQWSHGKAFIQVLGEIELHPGEEKSFVEEWAQVDNNGNQVGAGEYEVEGIVTSDPAMSVAKWLIIGGVEGGEVALKGKRTRKR
ncbi:MAG: carboxypeptidase regulatory-like domain-containing protein [Armatimonadota bacterium]|nr:carboxypeptidase regulatory-like domain-containing protein [Armatimonadota bacterium]MCX7777400.1 carboxypeptidase regulatory-like domain-containing protein [Armatimonadota bacterium]MDW8025069.1 carboxypeptidase regulatory-like domain-containing protein [Armatimonadota bacterium]